MELDWVQATSKDPYGFSFGNGRPDVIRMEGVTLQVTEGVSWFVK